jgi:hypothetical protein
MPDKVSPSQFAASVKAKYPEYKDVDDLKLTNAMIEKYPEYKDKVDFGIKETPVQANIVMPGQQPSVSKYQKAVDDDRSEIGKTLSTFYNNAVASLERFGGAIADIPAQFNVAAPGFAPTEIGKTQERTKAFRQQPLANKLETAKELKQKIGKTADIVRSGYTTREEERAMVGQFNVMDGGIGLRDIQSLIASSGGMALDMGLGAVTGGTSFVLQGYNDAVEDYDAAAAKAGLAPSEGARGLYGIAGGVINGLLEKFAVDKIVGDTPVFRDIQRKAIANVLRNTANVTGKKAVDAIETAAVAEIKKLTSDLKRFGIRSAYRAGIEGGTESVQAALEDGAKFAANAVQGNEVFNEDEIKKGFFQNIVNSGVAGSIMGPVFGASADKLFGRNVNTQVLQDIAEANTPEQLAAINDELAATFDENNFTQEERDAVMANANRYAQIKQTLPQGTSALAQTIAIPLIEDRIKLDNEIQNRKNNIENVDEALRTDEEASISLLEDKRAQINDDIREVVTDEKFNYFEQDGKFFKQLGQNAPEEISRNRFDLQQLKTTNNATQTSEGTVQEGGTTGNIGQRQGTQEGGTQETTTQANSRYRNISSEKAVGIPSFLGMQVSYKLPTRTITGTLVQEGQTLSVEDENGDVVAELGNVDELSNMAPEDMNLRVIEPNVELTENGFSVDGKELFNENENPFDAVSVDQNGNVMNVVLTTAGGKRRKFRGRVAQKIADQIDVRENQRIEENDQKLQEKFALPKPKAPVVITTQPTIARVTEDNLNDIDNIPGSKLQKKVLGNVKTVVKAIGAAVKNITGSPVSVNIHDQKSFTEAVIEAGGTEQDSTSRGFYMADDGSIHLNMDAIASDTMLHEGFHPILDILAKYNPKIINELFTEMESIPEAAGIIAQAKESYTGDVTQKKEAITDFVAGVADGRIILNPSNFQKIKNFILNMLNKIGIGQGGSDLMKVNSEKDLVKLATFITEKFATGETITFEGLEAIVGDDTADPVTVSNIAVVNPIQFEYVKTNDKAYKRVDVKWVSKGLNLIVPKIKSSLYNIVSKSGGAIVVTNSDATGVGMRKGVLRQGGIGYTFIEQNVNDNIGFAASVDSKQSAFFKAVQEAARIRDEKFPEMKGKPVAVFVMVQAPEVMFGNAYGADYFIKALSNALSNNEISTEDAKADVINYFNSIKESNATGRKYANSIDALTELIQNGNLKSAKDKKKIYDLLITNRENKEDKSAKFGFDARRVLFGQFFNKVAPAKNKPGGRTRDILGKDGYNHKSFYDIYGDENVIKSLEGDTEGKKMDDGGFTMTGFFVDPTITEAEYIKRSRSGTFQHKQFNSKFAGNEPFVLDGKYYVNEVFPEARFVDEFGNPVPVTTSTAGSMYPRTRSEPQAIVERAKAISEPTFQSQKIPKKDTSKFLRTGPQAMANNLKVGGEDISFVLDYINAPSSFLNNLQKVNTSNKFFDFNRDIRSKVAKYIKNDLDFWKNELKKKSPLSKEGDISQVKLNLINKYQDRVDALTTALDIWENNAFSPSDISINDSPVGSKAQFQKAPTKPITKGRGGIIKKGFKEQVRYGILGKENVRLKELMSGELSAELATAETRVKETMKTIKKYGGSVTEKDISDFMQGNSNGNQIPLDLATQLSEMRAQIDGLTERLIQLGVVDSQESIDYYRDNMGKYMLRSYESINFKDTKTLSTLYGKGLNIDNVAKKLKNVDKTVVDAALKYLSDRAKAADPTLTDAEAMKIARADANEILSSSEDYVMNKGLTGSTNVKSLRQRKDISPEIRALMGEYTDPLYNYYSTVFKIASLTSSRQYLNSLKEFGMGKFFFENKTEDATVKFAGDESDALAPLNGIYTFPEIKESLQIAQKETTNIFLQMAGRVRMFKTVYNPSTHVKNIIGNMGFAVSNGHWNNLPEAYKYIKGSIKGGSNKDVMQMMETLNRYGVLNNVIGVGELKSYFDNNESIDDFLKTIYNNANKSTTAATLGKAKANLSKIPKAIEKAYAIEDDVFKILAFVNESNRYAQAIYNKKYDNLSATEKKEIDGIASEIVKDTFPTFSRVPKGVKTLSKVAFLGNFLSFPVESVRTQYNSLALARKEIKSGNSKLKRIGLTRLSGAIAYNSLFSTLSIYAYNLAGAGLTGAIGMMFGDDEEENKTSNAIKMNLAPWNKNSEVYVSRFKDGFLEYYDIGSLDSYGYQRRVWNAFWSTKNKGEFDEMMASGIGEALDPWMTKDFVISSYMGLTQNDDGRGGNIYNPEAKPMDKYIEMSKYVGKQFGPGAVGSAIKIADAYQKGEYDKVMDELGAQVFARHYTVDLNKQFQNYIYTEGAGPDKEVGFKDRLSDARKLYLDAKRQNLTPVELSRKYQEALDQYKSILLTANEYYNAAILGGTNPKTLRQSMAKSRIGRDEAKAIITGAFSKYDQAYIPK